MAKMDSNNPMLRDSVFEKNRIVLDGEPMTRGGAIGKTVLLFLILCAGAYFGFTSVGTVMGTPAVWIALLVGGTALSFITAFVPRVSPVTAPLYALAEGALVGCISAAFESLYSGIIVEAVLITFAMFLVTLVFYSAGLIRVTNRFRIGVVMATLGIGLVYLLDMGLSLFGMSVPFLSSTSTWGIAINIFIVIIAGLNFMLDFDYIDRAQAMEAPKYMEWYMGYSLMVTFVWLYMEVLRLLSRIQSK